MTNKTEARYRLHLLGSAALIGIMIGTPAAAQTQAPAEVPAAAEPAPPADQTTGAGQDQAASPGDASTGEGETIVVTGSRIARPQLEGASPVSVINSAEVKLQGTTRVEDLVNSLPQAFAEQGGSLSNGSTGIATINLRGIGSSRTLVLVNGRRLVPGDPRTPVPDINAIPANLIERVDVLTGGASSVYGADAVAGVVNFVMDTDFEGFRVDAQYSFYQHDNSGDSRVITALTDSGFPFPRGNTVGGGILDTSLTFGAGTDDGRGHVTAYAGYRKIKPLLQTEYDYSACSLDADESTPPLDAFACVGSGTTAPAQFLAFDADTFTELGAFTPDAAAAGTFRAYDPVTDSFNFAPYNYFQRPDERFTFGVFANYEVSSFFQPYLETSFMDDRTLAQIAPSGAFGVAFNVACAGGNPLISAAQLATLCAPFESEDEAGNPVTLTPTNVSTFALRRNVEGGGRVDDLRHTQYRIVGGFKGDISENWSYDIYGQFGRTVFSQAYFNDFSITRIGRALDVVSDATGAPACRTAVPDPVSGVVVDPLCVPYNIFTSATSIQGDVTQGVTQAALNYVQTPGFSRGQLTEQIISASVSGDLGLLSPWAEDGIGVAAGVEYRKESLEFNNDVAFQTGDLAGQGGPQLDVSGNFDVKEIFGEVRLPLAENMPFLDELSVEASYRYSDYTTRGAAGDNSFTTDTYKVGAEWAPIQGARLRGSYSRAVRAPNVVELFSAQSLALFTGDDPCSGDTPSFTAEQCANTGVSAAQYGNITANTAEQYNQFLGGNPELDPEKADTWTAGVVLAPRGFLAGLTASVDFFDIKVENLISTVGAQLILNQCGLTGDPFFCNQVVRAPGTGSLWLGATGTPTTGGSGFVTNLNVNVGGLHTRGIDAALDYRMDLGAGGLAFNFVGTWLESYETDPGISTTGPGGETVTSYECKGLFGQTCGVPAPEWRHKLRVTYTAPSVWSASVNWRYIGKVTDETTSSNPFLTGDVLPAHDRIKAQNYFDVALSADVTENATVRVGVNNVLDNDPPIFGTQAQFSIFANGNTYPQVYDALGRYVFVGASFGF